MYVYIYVIFFSITILFAGLLYLYYPVVKSYAKRILFPNANKNENENIEKIKEVMRKAETPHLGEL